MTPSQITLLKGYEEKKIAIKELETDIEDMKESILQFMPEDSEVETADGKFKVARKRSWTYSPTLTEMEVSLKEQKKDEERNGVAKEGESKPYLVYTQKKDK